LESVRQDLIDFGTKISADDWTVETLSQPKLLDDSDYFYLDDSTDAAYLYQHQTTYTDMGKPQVKSTTTKTSIWGKKTVTVKYQQTNGYSTQHSHSISAARPITSSSWALTRASSPSTPGPAT
jgi:hypothetical protein